MTDSSVGGGRAMSFAGTYPEAADRDFPQGAETLPEPYGAILDALDQTLKPGKSWKTNAKKIGDIIRSRVPDLNWAGVFYLENGALWCRSASGGKGLNFIPLNDPLKKGICGAVMEHGQLRNVPDVTDDCPEYLDGHDIIEGPTQSALTLALTDDTGRIGVLNVESRRLKRFGREDEIGFKAIVSWLANWQRQHRNIFPPPSARTTKDAAAAGKVPQSDVKTEETKSSTIVVGDRQQQRYDSGIMDEMTAQFHAVADKALSSGVSITEFKEAVEKLTAKAQAARETTVRAAAEPCAAIDEPTQHTAPSVTPTAAAHPAHETADHAATESALPDATPDFAASALDATTPTRIGRRRSAVVRLTLPPLPNGLKWPTEHFEGSREFRKHEKNGGGIVNHLDRVWRPLVVARVVDMSVLRTFYPTTASAIDTLRKQRVPETGERRQLPDDLDIPLVSPGAGRRPAGASLEQAHAA